MWISSAVTSSGVPIDVIMVNSRTSSRSERRWTGMNGAALRPGAGARHSAGPPGWARTRASRRARLSSPGRAAVGDGAAQRGHLVGVERGRPEGGGEAGGGEQGVALAERDVEGAGQREHEVAARLCAAVLDEAQVARRYARARGELLLAD